MNKYTSLELSKLLNNNGCKLSGSAVYIDRGHLGYKLTTDIWRNGSTIMTEKGEKKTKDYCAYDILNDICVKYPKEFFGKKDICNISRFAENPFSVALLISLLQQNKKQEAEDYIWEHTIFNPKNQ